MRTIYFSPLQRPMSLLALGTMQFRQDRIEWVYELLDFWAEAGGTTLDCAHNYGDGDAERAVGRWISERGNRANTILLTKGCHPDASGPRVNPAAISQDLSESLDRLGTDWFDIYLLHRDDPSVPVDELVDALDAQCRAGRVRAVGVSNWTYRRIQEANAYALSHNRTAFTVSSPHLSLARQSEPPWPGCVSAADDDARAFYADNDLLVMPWSSQASGYFANPKGLSTTMGRVYDTPENRERLRRVREVSTAHGTTSNQVALAWVLAQPFTVVPVIGALSTVEIADSMAASDISLTPAELDWLDLRTGTQPHHEETA